jgi:hypothetical protein
MTNEKIKEVGEKIKKLFPVSKEPIMMDFAITEAWKEATDQARKDFEQLIRSYIYCDNCRFACQASDCECVCHRGWIKQKELLEKLKSEVKA